MSQETAVARNTPVPPLSFPGLMYEGLVTVGYGWHTSMVSEAPKSSSPLSGFALIDPRQVGFGQRSCCDADGADRLGWGRGDR